ncbi:NHS-like protein 3 isoform X2 [Latimeria chalumnae]|uniref:NHS-like protein 3 isoform X2 n=1 Tax=Latimeria chalumnae TaxID=7897 RepID=UPI00313DFB05
MGNAHHKKKPSQNTKPRSLWNFGRSGKHKAASPRQNDGKLTVHYKASQHQQANVFFPSDRPSYLEDLHQEAQEGLKSLQQQEKENQNRNGLDFSDNSSIHSSQTLSPEEEAAFRRRSESCTSESATVDSLSIQSEMVQRKGSTFKPHNIKKSEKTKKERKLRRTTIMGLPQHVQKELRHRMCTKEHQAGTPAQPLQPKNGSDENTGVVCAPNENGNMQTKDFPGKGARVSLYAIGALRSSRAVDESDIALQSHINKVYYDDTLLNRQCGPRVSPEFRPRSLAVPGMTTSSFQNELHGPVMSISPQATYLSKIIPNAILPSSVDVIAISRNSVRTLSRTSLTSASPASVRSSIRSSVKHYNSTDLSSSSENWSHSQSSETIVSNSSTISSRGSTAGTMANSKADIELQKEKDICKHVSDQRSRNSSANWISTACTTNGQNLTVDSDGLLMVKQGGGSHGSRSASPAPSTSSMVDGSDTISIQSDRSISRSLSVRKMKKAPAPPTRKYSLNQQLLKTESKEMQESSALKKVCVKPSNSPVCYDPWIIHPDNQSPMRDEVFLPSSLSETSSVRSEMLAYAADYSSPDVSGDQAKTREMVSKDFSPQKLNMLDKFDRTMSPSSGYSSQSGTPTLPTKGLIMYPSSPGKKRACPKKPERSSSSVHSPVMSMSSSLTSLSSSTSDPVPQEQTSLPITTLSSTSTLAPAVNVKVLSSTKVEHEEDFVIPPPPKVQAPLSPPPFEARTALPTRFAAVPFSKRPPAVQKTEDKEAILPVSIPSPPPSPPPSHHPPPPPVKKTIVSEVSISSSSSTSSEIVQVGQTEVFWPPPPPPLPLAETETSISNYPPLDEAEFQFPPPPPPIDPSTSVDLGTSTPKSHLELHKSSPPAEETLTKTKMLPQSLPIDHSKKVDKQGIPNTAPATTPLIPSKPSTSIVASSLSDASCLTSTSEPPQQKQLEKVEPSSIPASPPSTSEHQQQKQLEKIGPSFIPASPSTTAEPPQRKQLEKTGLPSVPASHPTTTSEPPPEEHLGTAGSASVPSIPESPPTTSSELPPQKRDSEETVTSSAVSFPTTTSELCEQKHMEKLRPPPAPAPPPLAASSSTSTSELPHQKQLETVGPPLAPSAAASHSPQLHTVPQFDQQNQFEKLETPPAASIPIPPVFAAKAKTQQSFKKVPNVLATTSTKKEPFSRSKSTPVPKEDANIPIVTPSLLQMVRLRSVNASTYAQASPHTKPVIENSQAKEEEKQSVAVPQKPVRKSLSLRVSPTAKESVQSMQLQNAVRLKASALSSKNITGPTIHKTSLDSGNGNASPNAISPKSPITPLDGEEHSSSKAHDDGGIHKSPASTASFIFSKTSKKVVIETPSSPEAQADLKKNLVAELMVVSGPKTSNHQIQSAGRQPLAQKKPSKIPPPVARKPSQLVNTQYSPKPLTSPQPQAEGVKSPTAVDSSKAVPLSVKENKNAASSDENHKPALAADSKKTMQLAGQEKEQQVSSQDKRETVNGGNSPFS